MPELWPKKEGSQTKRKLFRAQEPYSYSSGLQGTQIDVCPTSKRRRALSSGLQKVINYN